MFQCVDSKGFLFSIMQTHVLGYSYVCRCEEYSKVVLVFRKS
jgi:hypothetical protein